MSSSDTEIDAPPVDSDATEIMLPTTSSGPSRPRCHPNPLLDGYWSEVRLFKEAHLDDAFKCASWMVDVGLLITPNCRIHRKPRQLAMRSDASVPVFWCGSCRDRVSALTGTIFAEARLPLGKALMLVLSFAHGLSYQDAARACVFQREDSPVANSTVSHYYSLLREILIGSADQIAAGGGPQIGGPGMIVQVDEALVGRRKFNVGRGLRESWIFGMVDEAGQLRMEICPGGKRDRKTLTTILEKHVCPGSIIHSDGWAGYARLDELGFTHSRVNHKQEFIAADGTHTQRIESLWRSMRRGLTPGGKRHDDLADYLVEYMWRRECARGNRDPFASLILLIKNN